AAYPENALDILTKTAENSLTAIRVNSLKTTPTALAELLHSQGVKVVEENAYLPNSLRVAFVGSPADCPAFQEGLFHVEGETSQIAALALGAKAGDTVIDFCAAPGGKSLAIAQEMQDKGKLYSCDVSPNRVSLIEKAVQRMGVTCAVAVQNDAATQNPIQGAAAANVAMLADKILADVPCSGLGILAKKPDIRYKDLVGMPELLCLQAEILENAAACLAVGGRLVYSTCTINPAENQEQIKAFLASHPEFTLAPIAHLPSGMQVSEYGALSLPHLTNLDGFFICALEKH
ncbi:MAG: SAM-dependent methyltransferase, partial [Faecalibacterium sp.]